MLEETNLLLVGEPFRSTNLVFPNKKATAICLYFGISLRIGMSEILSVRISSIAMRCGPEIEKHITKWTQERGLLCKALHFFNRTMQFVFAECFMLKRPDVMSYSQKKKKNKRFRLNTIYSTHYKKKPNAEWVLQSQEEVSLSKHGKDSE